MHYIDFTTIVNHAWAAYDSSRPIKSISDISARVSTNHVYKIIFPEGDFVIAKLSYFGKYDHFIDIGCGKGRAVLYMACVKGIKKSIGVELVSERATYAKSVVDKMKDKYNSFLNNVAIIEGDFTKQNYANIFDKNARIFIWISNLCFTNDVNAKILNKIQQEFGDRFVICCSQELPHNNKLKKIFVEQIKMSWDPNSNVHAYIPV